MRKFIFFIISGCMIIFLQSCTKTCTCVDPNNRSKELEIDPSESCFDRSDTIWQCS